MTREELTQRLNIAESREQGNCLDLSPSETLEHLEVRVYELEGEMIELRKAVARLEQGRRGELGYSG